MNCRRSALERIIWEFYGVRLTERVRGMALVVLACACARPAPPLGSSIAGEAVQWPADYCLFETGIDDLIAAEPCMECEAVIAFPSDCARQRHCECTGVARRHAGKRDVVVVARTPFCGPPKALTTFNSGSRWPSTKASANAGLRRDRPRSSQRAQPNRGQRSRFDEYGR